MQKVWNLKKYDEYNIKKISEKYNISPMLSKFLVSREVKAEDIPIYLNGTLDDLRDPFEIKDMQKFVDRVLYAINNNEKICIYGDYDVDGITSITIMYKFLKSIGADVIYYLPDRLVEGYGLNNDALDYINNQGAKLIITVDCGITAVNETKYAKKLGIDMCITDHHECSDNLPESICIINPKQKDDKSYFKFHAGVGVAFKCITALGIKLNLDKEEYLKYIDIVAIGTVSDIVALLDENRIISKYGISQIENTTNVGLKALIEVTSFKKIDSTMISFGIAPRINACGRMGNASLAVKLFLENDYETAKKYAVNLDELNHQRQQIEKNIYDDAIKIIDEKKLYNKKSIVIYNESWHSGVIGIVCSRLVGIYGVPVILLTKENNVVRGSGRCSKGISLYDMLSKCEELLIQFGGHDLAAGLSIEEKNIEHFAEKFEEVVSEFLGSKDVEQVIDIDSELTLKDLNVNLLKDIYTLRPYGQANQAPLFLYKNLKVQSVRTLADGKHLKLTLKDNNKLIDAIGFSFGDRRDEVKLGDKIDIVCEVELNEFDGKRKIQFLLKDFKLSLS